MIKYFKEILVTLKKIEEHLSKLSRCVNSDKYHPELKVDNSVPPSRRY